MKPGAYWLASYPKSGNTWVRLFLAAYRAGIVDINSNLGPSQSDIDKSAWMVTSPISIENLTEEMSLYLRNAVLFYLLATRRTDPPVIKTHCANKIVHGIELFPDGMTAGVIHIVRDPRDVTISFAKHTGQTIEQTMVMMNEDKSVLKLPTDGVTSWVGDWSIHTKSWTGDLPLQLRYEDMKADPKKAFSSIVEYLKLELDEDKLDRAIDLTTIDKLQAQEDKNGFIERGKQEKFFGGGKGWKNVLTDKQARRIEEDHGEVMEQLGYKLEFL